MRILFQGDSIVESGRNREIPEDLGTGFSAMSAEAARAHHPGTDFTFFNRGIGGHKAMDLRARWQTDCIDLAPDLVSIHVGANDACFREGEVRGIPNDLFEEDYRFLLTEIKEKTNAKIIILEPFFIPGDMDQYREFLAPKIQIVRRLAREYADAFIPTDSIFAAASLGTRTIAWSEDTLHPNRHGYRLMAQAWVKTFDKLFCTLK